VTLILELIQEIKVGKHHTVLEAQVWVVTKLKRIIGLADNGSVEMDPIYSIEKSLKEIRQRVADLTEILATGGVADWEGYQRILGELSGLSSAERIILDLLNKEEKQDDTGRSVKNR
jgi:hypothetical protein|tara:strand:+ start:442 stop:792 length:351 start_codon:yes stop_codon:yes gene_type:complete